MMLLALICVGPLTRGIVAHADEHGYRNSSAPWRPEIRWALMHPEPGGPERGSAVVSAELLFSPFHPDSLEAHPWYLPKFHVGLVANLGGGTSYAYTGFTLAYDVTPRVFVEGALGVAGHNGATRVTARRNRALLGCSFAFREAVSLGYRITKAWSAMLTLEHVSNAGLCSQNRGLTNFGLRIGYRF